MTESVDAIQLNLSTTGLLIMNISLACIMFGVALELTVADFKNLLKHPKCTLVGVFSQFVLLPFLTFLLIIVMEPAPSLALGMMMVAACPGGNISNFFSMLAKGNTALSVGMTAIATTLAIVMTPLNFSLWASLYEPTNTILREVSIDLWQVFQTIVLILGFPLIIGMLVRHYKPDTAKKVSKYIKNFGILFFSAFVLITFGMNFDNFLQFVHLVILLVFLHNFIALTSGYGIAKLSGLPYEDRKSISIETGIQNSGLGLLLIFTFFDGLGGMALVAAWWGMWHIIAGLTLSWYWSKGKDTLQRMLGNA